MASLAVDWGRVQVAKTQLRSAVDAAARYGVTGLDVDIATVQARCIEAGTDNTVDGTPLVISNNDIEFGSWDAGTRVFTVRSSNDPLVSAIRVTGRRTSARGNPITLMFFGAFGQPSVDMTAVAISSYRRAVDSSVPVPAAGNPWLAGMPSGTEDNTNLYNANVRNDRAGAYTDANGVFHPTGESPALYNGVALTPGETLNFDSIAGTTANGATQTQVGPDGKISQIMTPYAGAHYGKSTVKAPLSSLVAVFLTSSSPAASTPPDGLDFTTQAQRDFVTLEPQIGQVFFIGDGITSAGVVQHFKVPAGATRLYLGTMDGTEWNNNTGASTVITRRPGAVTLRK